jgi:hypothetical protein
MNYTGNMRRSKTHLRQNIQDAIDGNKPKWASKMREDSEVILGRYAKSQTFAKMK